jgi:hypothetical protein
VNYYNKIGLCHLINLRTSHGANALLGDHRILCAERNLEKVEKLLSENVPIIQETIYQIFMMASDRNDNFHDAAG